MLLEHLLFWTDEIPTFASLNDAHWDFLLRIHGTLLTPYFSSLDLPRFVLGAAVVVQERILRAAFGSSNQLAHGAATDSYPYPCCPAVTQFSTTFLLVSRNYCLEMMHSTVYTSACEIMIHISEESSRSTLESGRTWWKALGGCPESLTLNATLLSTPYNKEHCQGHLLNPYWQLLWWSWLMTGQLGHFQRQLQLVSSV